MKKTVKWKVLLPTVVVLLFVAMAFACDHGLHLLDRDLLWRGQREVVFDVIVVPVENGTVTAIPNRAIRGTLVTLVVNPDPGYRLPLANALITIPEEVHISGTGAGSNLPYRFTLNGNVQLTPNFVPVPTGMFTASVAQDITGGTIAVYREFFQPGSGEFFRTSYGNQGQTLSLVLYPDPGYVLSPGSLRYYLLDGDHAELPGTQTPIDETTLRFNRPFGNVMIRAEFNRPADVDQFLDAGRRALWREDFNTAAIAFEAAYQLDPSNQEAVFFSSLARLGNVFASTEVQRVMRQIGFAGYPNQLNNLLGSGDSWSNINLGGEGLPDNWYRMPSWLANYIGITLPRMGDVPGGIWQVQNQSALITGTRFGDVSTMATYYIYLFLYLMGTQIDSLNVVVDDILRHAFGDGFEEALARAASMQGTIELDAGTARMLRIPVLGDRAAAGRNWHSIGDFFGENQATAHVGRAELDMVFSVLLLFRAGLEWIGSYDINFDRYFFRMWGFAGTNPFIPHWYGFFNAMNAPFTERRLGPIGQDIVWTLNQTLNELADFLLVGLFTYYDDPVVQPGRRQPWNPGAIPDMLPLLNNFLRQRMRAGQMMDRSRASLLRAIAGFENARAHYFNPANHATMPENIRDDLANYQWAEGLLRQLRTAVETGGNFYFPHLSLLPVDEDRIPDSGWNYDSGDARFGVNMGRLFTPGQLNLDRLIVTLPGGRFPRFFGWDGDPETHGEGTEIRRLEEIEQFDHVGLKLNMGALREVVVRGLHRDDMAAEYRDIENAHVVFPGLLFSRTVEFPDPIGPREFDNAEMLFRLYHGLYSFDPSRQP